MISILIVYAIITATLYVVGYWFLCKSYNSYVYKHRFTFSEYFEDNSGYVVVPAILWPLLILLSPVIILIYVCYLLTKKIKKYHDIEN